MDHSFFHNYAGVKRPQQTYNIDIDSHKQQSIESLSQLDTESYLKGLNLEYDEIELLSECSTPVSYVPGKYLQLCDIIPDEDKDFALWRITNRPSLTEANMTSLVSGPPRQVVDEGYLYNKTFRKSPRYILTNSKLVITIVVCVVVALTALGGLATFV